MPLFSAFSSEKVLRSDGQTPIAIDWWRNARGKYPRLAFIEPVEDGLSGVGGVYVIWHRGVRPRWVYVGAGYDMGKAVEQARSNRDIADLEVHGGLFFTCSPVKEGYRDGVVRYLHESLRTEFDPTYLYKGYNAEAAPIPVTPPK